MTSITTPFAVDSMAQETTYTYMDTTGHPTIVLHKHACSDIHGQDILVRRAA
jgi:oligosaccharyltransferase complex subunit alpha (ribophorin I)